MKSTLKFITKTKLLFSRPDCFLLGLMRCFFQFSSIDGSFSVNGKAATSFMKSLLLTFAFIYNTDLFAQKNKVVTVRAGTDIMDVLSTADVLHYPRFTNGKVFFKDGTVTEANLNYNHLVNEMHFISARGDTLVLANENNIKYIVIGNDSFYYDHGYLRLLASGNLLKLALKQIWIISDTRPIGAYDTPNSSVSITSYATTSEHGRLYDLVIDEDLVLKKVEQFYIGDNYNHFVLADKKNLLMLFPKQQERIEIYLKENKINFNKKDDLEKIVQSLTL